MGFLAGVLFGACAEQPGMIDGQPPIPPGEEIGFMEVCELAQDKCDPALELFCFSFNTKGTLCSKSCEVDADCEEPSTGCNGMGVCKAPGGGDGGGGGGGDD